MKISYVLPVYNAEAEIATTIKSLLTQSVKAHEIIVVNDASTDHTEEILKTYGKKIKVISLTERKGGAYCRNLGNQLSTGDIIAVCDTDIYYKDRGKAIMEFFELHGDYDVFYSAVHLRDSKQPMRESVQEAVEWDCTSKCPISHPSVAYKRHMAIQCPYSVLSLETDLFEFCLLDMHKAGAKFGWSANPLMIKIEGGSSRDKKRSNKLKQRLYKSYGIEVPEELFV